MLRNGWSILLAVALLAGCQTTDTVFKDQTNNGFEVDDDVDENPTTVNNSTATNGANGGTHGMIDVEGPGEAPDTYWVPETDEFVLRDNQTGSLWNLRGEAFDGPLAGLKLKQVPAFNSFWFAWSVFYDGSEIWNRDETNETAPVRSGDECLVPCDEIRQACGGGKDCIPALDYDGTQDRPVAKMVGPDDPGAGYLDDDDFVFGVAIDGEARAYPHNIFWWHEIYNDEIGDTEFSVTFCPLTGSGLVFEGIHDGNPVDFGVSGNLYNSNLVMFDRQTDTLWSQMTYQGISGDNMGDRLTLMPVVETTWARWKQMYPDTRVASDDQGYSRDYNSYPYGDYRTNDENTFRATNPAPDGIYDNKARVLGLPDGETKRAYAFEELANFGDRVVVNDTIDGRPIVIAYEKQHRLALPFYAEVDGQKLTFEGAKAP